MIRFLAISITLLLLLAAPLYAGMEPFYKGEWGMSPKEIQKLYGYEPFDTYADRETNSVTNRYETTIDGHTVFVAYTFDQSFWGLKLRGAYFEFLFDNSRLNHLQLAQLQALTNKMAALVQSPAEPFEQERHATANSGFAD